MAMTKVALEIVHRQANLLGVIVSLVDRFPGDVIDCVCGGRLSAA